MSKRREVRKAEIRQNADGKPGVTLKAFRSGTVDDYGSLWKPDAADEALGTRLPTLVWAHDWNEPLGPAVGFRSTPDGPEVDFHFSDFDAVPMARRAHAQVSDGTIRDASVGFVVPKGGRREPTDEEVRTYPGVREVIERADIDEVSLVLRGAVPGAKVLAVRSASAAVDTAVELARRVKSGELTREEAKAALDLLAEDGGEGEGDDDDADDITKEPKDPPADPPPAEDLDAEMDEAFAVLDRSRQQ